jgi:hypothetical protein
MNIKIIKGFGWYENEVGNTFEINDKKATELNNRLCYPVIENGETSLKCIAKEDFEELIH